MEDDDLVCLCFRVSQRKLVNYMARERPRVASQLSECLGAGTGCQWCVPFLRRLHAQWERGERPDLPVSPEEYARRRTRYRATGTREPIAGPAGEEYDRTSPAVNDHAPKPVRIPLTQLARGQRAVVDCSELTGLPEGERCLLHAMGLHDQCQVRVCSAGSTCIVQIESTRLGISSEVARRILVTPIEGTDGAP